MKHADSCHLLIDTVRSCFASFCPLAAVTDMTVVATGRDRGGLGAIASDRLPLVLLGNAACHRAPAARAFLLTRSHARRPKPCSRRDDGRPFGTDAKQDESEDRYQREEAER